MLKMRLKRNGRKRQPSYKLVIMENRTRREGIPVDQVGYYNSITKKLYINEKKILKWLRCGVQPTTTVFRLLMLQYRYPYVSKMLLFDPDAMRIWTCLNKFRKNQNRRKCKPIRRPRDGSWVPSKATQEKLLKRVNNLKKFKNS